MTDYLATSCSELPDLGRLEIPVDPSTEPFWDATARGELRVPSCGDCGTHRWPPGPFCHACRSQAVEWVNPGEARLYSFTIVRQRDPTAEKPGRLVVPGLCEFPDAGVRIMAAILGRVGALRIGAALRLTWTTHGDKQIPVFELLEP